MDVPCWVSVPASTHDLHYDQKRNACWWMTGDSYGRQKERGGGGKGRGQNPTDVDDGEKSS